MPNPTPAAPATVSNVPPQAGFDTQRLVFAAGHADQLLHGVYFQPVLPEEDLRRLAVGKDALDRLASAYRLLDPRRPDGAGFDSYVLARLRPGRAPVAAGAKKAAAGKTQPHAAFDWLLQNGLGVLFYDRLRYRYAGSMAKERVYSLSLGPGEESTVAEHSETKLTRSFESTLVREDEMSSTIGSRWSTEVTQMAAFQANTAVGGNLGANVGGQLDFLRLGTDGAVNFQSSSQTSGQSQSRFAYELSNEMTRKAREQHTTTVKVGAEQTFGMSNRRSIINRNHSRSLTLHFHKVYGKYQVSLERHDAKLALSLHLQQPYSRILDRIDRALDAIDPDNPANYTCTAPAAPRTHTYSVDIEWEDPNDVVSYGPGYWAFASQQLAPRNGEVLHSYEAPKIVAFRFRERRGNLWVNGTARDVGDFREKGGTLLDSLSGGSLGTPGTPTLSLQAWNAKSLGGPAAAVHGTWWTRGITVEIEAHFGPDPATAQGYRECLQRERERLKRELTPQRLAGVVAANVGDLDSHVLMEVINRHFAQRMPESDTGFLIREFRNYFDWNEAIVDQLPGWMASGLREQHDRLLARLRRMLPGVDAEQLLPARLASAGVQVVLPLRPGAEESVFHLMTMGRWNGESAVQAFRAMRDAQFGPAATAATAALPAFDQHMAPGEPPVTRHPAPSDWVAAWEKPQRKFQILGQWADSLPQDGVHIEPVLGDAVALDEWRAAELRAASPQAAAPGTASPVPLPAPAVTP